MPLSPQGLEYARNSFEFVILDRRTLHGSGAAALTNSRLASQNVRTIFVRRTVAIHFKVRSYLTYHPEDNLLDALAVRHLRLPRTP